MKEYKIGDTVWTRKRGKGTITDHSHYTAQDRPWRVHFESCVGFYSPKAENLYPSEAEYKKAQFLKGKRTVTIDFSCLEPYPSGWMTTDPIQPKFKVGDAVYYKGKKYTIRERYWSGEKWKYNMTKPIDAESGNLLIGMNESDLRLWKETVLTHCLQVTGEWRPTDKIRFFNTEKYDILNYVGTVEEEDRFIGYKKSQPNHPYFFRGIKGDDI